MLAPRCDEKLLVELTHRQRWTMLRSAYVITYEDLVGKPSEF